MGTSGVLLLHSDDEKPTASTPAPTSVASDESTPSGLASLSSDCLTAAEIYERVRPAVVQVSVAAEQVQGAGTGIVIDDEGHVLTNNHVVNAAAEIEVRLGDGSTSSARVIGRDPANDLAVIQADNGGELEAAELGDSDSLRVGDPVLAIGNPFNLEATLTQGIVSAIGRTYAAGATTRPIRGMIQTDAAVNPGNSGGPLLNCRGEVVGINTLLENPSGQNVNVGIAFAVAINTAKRSLSQMLAGDTVSHPWLGIAGVAVTPVLAEELGLEADSGVYVTLVSSSSPADEAGLQAAFTSQNQAAASTALRPGGDVILTVDGEAVKGIDELATYLDQHKQPGDSVELAVLRHGEEMSLSARLAEWPA